MQGTAEPRLRLRLWVLLSAALIALGCVAVFMLSRVALQRFSTDYKADLLRSSELLALGMESDSKPEDSYLARAGSLMQDIDQASILALTDGRFTPTASFSSHRNVTSALAPEDAAVARRVLETKEPLVETAFVASEVRLKAFVPLRDEEGSVGRVLMVSQKSAGLQSAGATVSKGVVYGICLVTLLALIMAQIIASYMVPIVSASPTAKAFLTTKRLYRGAYYELAIAALLAIVIATAAYGLLSHGDVASQAATSLQRIQRIEEFRTRLFSAVANGGATADQSAQLANSATRADLRWPFRGEAATAAALLEQSRIAESEISREALNYEKLRDSASAQYQTMLGVFGVAAFLSMGALVLIRTTRRQERELDTARADIARQEAAYRHIADNLPIGFYTFVGGEIETTNAAWDRLVARDESETPWEAFVARLHPDDHQRVVNIFNQAEKDLNPFGIACRLQMADGTLRHVESRAVAVLDDAGAYQHVVGFLVDISSRVRAQRLLEDKNREVSATNDMLRKALAEIEDNFEAMVHSLVKAVEAKDPYTAGHSERVMAYSLKIAQRMGLSMEELRVLKMGTLIHDIGKIGIPDAILTKPARLTDEEYEYIKQHPMLGYKMIESIPTFAECLPIVLHHHERLDGKGYPFGLKGLEIPLLVRISTVADCFDAMTSDRAYRKGLDPQIAIDELFKSSDYKVVDRHIVEVLAEIIAEEGLTTVVNVSAA